MCPVDPRELASPTIHAIISGDRPCVSCGYNLKGLEKRGVCPECGHPISVSASRRGPKYFDQMMNADPGWLAATAWSANIMALGATFSVGAAIAINYRPSPAASLTLLLSTLVWWVGVIGCTRPRPVMITTTIDPKREWAVMRLVARLAPLGTIVWAGTALAMELSANSGTVLAFPIRIGAHVCGLIGLLGLVPLFVLLSNLAFWASDTTLAHSLRGSAFLVAGGVVMLSFAPFIGSGGFLGTLSGIFLFFGGGTLVMLLFAVYLYLVWRFRSMAAWARINHETADQRSERLRLKAEQSLRIGASMAEASELQPDGERPPSWPAGRMPSAGSRGRVIPKSKDRPYGVDDEPA